MSNTSSVWKIFNIHKFQENVKIFEPTFVEFSLRTTTNRIFTSSIASKLWSKWLIQPSSESSSISLTMGNSTVLRNFEISPYHVSDHISRRGDEERVAGVEDLPSDHREPLSQQTARILALFSWRFINLRDQKNSNIAPYLFDKFR